MNKLEKILATLTLAGVLVFGIGAVKKQDYLAGAGLGLSLISSGVLYDVNKRRDSYKFNSKK